MPNFLISLLFLLLACSPQDSLYTVVRVQDGDSFVCRMGTSSEIKVRLYGIDAPEKGQAFGKASKEYLGSLLQGEIRLVKKGKDRYGRIIAIAYRGSININERMIASGYAWHFKKYDDNPTWSRLEKEARNASKGLWAEPAPLAPWEYRKSRRAQ